MRLLTEITGNLDVTSASDLEIAEFPNLVRVRGRVYVYNDPVLTTFTAPRLRLAESLTFATLAELTEVSFAGLIDVAGGISLTSLGATADDALLLGMPWLVSIGADLSVNDARNLETLEGFGALQAVEGGVDVRTSAVLENADGLSELETVGGGIVIYNNATLTSIDLSALTQVGSSSGTSLNIQALPELTHVDVSALEETPGGVYLYQVGSTAGDPLELDLSSLRILRGNLDIQTAANLETLAGLSALEQVTGAIDIRSNASLADATDLAALESVGGGVVIYNNGDLEAIVLSSLTEVGSTSTSLNIQLLPELTTLDVSALEETPGGVYLYQLGATADGDLTMSFDALQIVRGNLDVQQDVNLLDLDAFSALQEVTGNIDVRTNESMVDASGFSNLETVGGQVVLYNNPQLVNISLASLAEIAGTLNVQLLPELTSVVASSLEEMPGQIYLYDLGGSANDDLTLDFTALEIVRSTVTVAYADNLVTVDAFSALTEVSGNLVIQNNAELVSLSGFDELVTLEGNLDVRGNTSLSECLPLLLRNRLQDEGFDGTATISGNMADTCD